MPEAVLPALDDLSQKSHDCAHQPKGSPLIEVLLPSGGELLH